MVSTNGQAFFVSVTTGEGEPSTQLVAETESCREATETPCVTIDTVVVRIR